MGGVWKRVVEVVWLIIIIIIIEGCFEGEGCLEQERSALLHLKPFFNPPPAYALRDWVDSDYSADCCQWDGVYCSNTTSTGRVTELDLRGIPRESTEKWYLNASLFTPFQQLESLSLSGNNIAGFVENEGLERLSELSNLQVLDLSYNYFNNSILSSLGALSSLRTLNLFNNRLKGSIDVKSNN